MAKKRKPFWKRVNGKLWGWVLKLTRNTPFKDWVYRSWWHYKFHQGKVKEQFVPTPDMYYGARPNFAAGIGHQMANWIDGLYWANKLGMKHVHFPFSTKQWDDFLGFGIGDPTIQELKRRGYKVRQLPEFNEFDEARVKLIRQIASTYVGQKVVLWPQQDHFYRDMFGVGEELRRRFDAAPARKGDNLTYSKDKFNIAIHVRRVVVIEGQVIKENAEQHARRWLANDYYETVLKQVLESIHPEKPIAIYIFSTGKAEEFAEFAKYGEVHFCSDMDEYTSFAHLIYADLLITSKSSFSYKPALMNSGYKVCPRSFWHGYPQDDPKWILCENNGIIEPAMKVKLQAVK